MIKTKSHKWQVQEAKNRFSEVIRRATQEGPQTITKHGNDTVVVISVEEYKNSKKPKNSIVDFFRNSPLADADIDLERDKSPARPIEL